MRFEHPADAREFELARAHVKATGAASRGHPLLRKIAALIHREETVGIIAERIITNDSSTAEIVHKILRRIWLDAPSGGASIIGQAIETFGWEVVREIAAVTMLHQVHAELAPRGGNSLELDRYALSVFAGAGELGVSGFGALFANVGVAGMLAIGGVRYEEMRSRRFQSQQEVSAEEKKLFGFDHGMMGAAMLFDADMPESLCAAAANHGRPGQPIWMAEALADAAGITGGICLAPRSDDASWFGIHRVSPRQLERSLTTIRSAASLPELYFGRALAKSRAA